MKAVKILMLFFGILVISSAGFSQVVDPSYEVGTWAGFRTSAVSYTFDDNDLNQLAVVVPMFNEFGYHLTLFTIISTDTEWKDPNWTGLQEAAEQGHEIANHTVTHPNFSQVDYETEEAEIVNSYNTIETNIPSQTWQTLAYPYCVRGTDSLIASYFIGARGCQGQVEPSTPRDMLNISSIICGTQGSVKTADHFNARVNSAVKNNGYCVFLMHGIDEDGGWSPTSSTELRSHLEYVAAHPDSFWVASFGDAIRYIKERNDASVTETSSTDTEVTCEVSDTLDNAIYNLPITVRRAMPAGWGDASVKQNDQVVNSQVVVEEGAAYIMFDVIPDGGPIVLTKTAESGVETQGTLLPSSLKLMQNFPNPFNPGTEIRFQLANAGQVDIRIVNSLGRDVAVLSNKRYASGEHTVSWDGRDMKGQQVSSGVYYCQIRANDLYDMKKMILAR